MPRINRTSAIRSGFDYQDFWGLKLCGEWLVNPKLYKWIQLETSPDEDDSNKFYLDDIVCLDTDDFYHFYQIKHKQDPLAKWTWDDFLIAKHNGGTSLIKKWAGSLSPRLDKSKEAFFVTNGQVSDEMRPYLDGEMLNIKRIKKANTDLYNRIVNEIEGEQNLARIFQIIRFRFDQENLAGDELESSIRKYFYEKLNATESGVTNLYHEIRKECRKRNTRQLDIELLRKWCEFDTPKPLQEQFNIPTDFEFFDSQTHQSILSDLQKPVGGIKVIFGKPGVGKSVYLSKLDEELGAKKIVSIKHHYHISPEDSNPQERLNADRVIEAIKAQFKLHKEDIGNLTNKNSKEIPLREFIGTLAKSLHDKNRTFVLIIDGLDHVPRQLNDINELKELLDAIFFPQPGVWIVLGTQPHIKNESGLSSIFAQCKIENQHEIIGLTKLSVNTLIKKNNAGLNLPADQQLQNLINKLYTLTQGNPLHLRYSLRQLKNLLGSSVVTEYSCTDLIPYDTDIEKYYNSLWNQISDNAKTLLLTVASVNFLFTEKQLGECASLSISNPADITNGFNEIIHLISKNLREQMSVYHNSFSIFLKNRPEFEQQKNIIKTNVKNWLEKSQYDYLKWAELRIIEYELGNSDPLLQIDRRWLIEAICYPCNANQISNQMKLAARAAFEKDDFGRALQISYLHTYYLNSNVLAEDAEELIWREALQHNAKIFDYINLKLLPIATLPTLVKLADTQGNTLVIKEITEILIEQIDTQEYRQNTVPRITATLLGVLPYDRQHIVKNIYKYIIQFRDLEIADILFGIYARQLIFLEQKEKLEELFKLELTEPEKGKVLIECVNYGYANKAFVASKYFEEKDELPLQCQLYKLLKDKTAASLPPLPQYDVFPQTIQEYDTGERAKFRNLFYQQFLTGLLYSIAGRQEDTEKWIKAAPDFWPAQAVSHLLKASIKIAADISQSKIPYIDLFASFSELTPLMWPENRDTLSFQHAFNDAIGQIVRDIILFKRFLSDNVQIQLKDYENITAKAHFFSKNDFLNIILDDNGDLLSQDLYKLIRDENVRNLSTSINHLSDRAKDYANLSKLAYLYDDIESSQLFLSKAADNLLGYGNHKDIYLFDVLEAIEFCARSGTDKKKINDWVTRVIPLIDNAGEYTDGDETNHLPFELADLLATNNPSLLYKYYYWSADQEELYHAEDLFKYVLKSFTFSTDEEIVLASTALDKDSLLQLKIIAKNSPDALKALDIIQSYLGEINYSEDEKNSYPAIKKPAYDYSKVSPDHLLNHLGTAFENRWERDNYLIGWLDHWLEKNSRENIYRILKQVIDKFSIQTLSGELLDVIYPLAYEFDNGAAFDILCNAQINDHGWQRYWTDKKKAEGRWKFIKDKYSRRHLEFFQKSTNYHVPLSRGVEFLLLFDDLENAEAITEASVQFAQSLMANLNLPSPEWLQLPREIDGLDILIQRLLWPSPLIRERAATGIANLFCTSKGRESTFRKLLLWIQQQKMESAIAIGLLPIIKAFYIVKNRNDLDYIKLQEIVDSIQINSVVIEKLIEELTHFTNTRTTNLPTYKIIDQCPTNYLTSTFFSKYIKTFLAPIYMQRAVTIERRSGKPFIKQWAFIADSICKDAGIILNANQVYYYGRSEHDEFLLGFSSKISEVYRSAFLRVLQHFYKNGDISEDFYLEYAYATLPVELSKWKILPGRVPKWWPQLKQAPKSDGAEQPVVPITFTNPLEKLIEPMEEKLIVAAEGAIQPSGNWASSDPMHTFLLIAFGYKVVGSQLPTAEEIAEKISYSPSLATIPSRTVRPFNFLEDNENYLSVRGEALRIKDMIIYPLVARERDLCIALWQYFRDYDATFNLNQPLLQNLQVVINKNNWHLRNKNKEIMATYTDFLEGLKERYDRDMPLPHGQYLTTNKAFLDEWLTSNNLRLGYMLKIVYRSRQYSHEEIKKYEDAKLLNVSSLII